MIKKKKKNSLTKMFIVETIEEFLARGGTVTTVPAETLEDDKCIIPVKTVIDFDLMSLGEGEYLFGESRTRKSKAPPKKRVSSEEFSSMVETSGLPIAIVEALKKSMGKK